MAVIKTSARMVPMLPEKAKPGTTVCVKNTSEEAAEIRMCECAEFWRQRKGEREKESIASTYRGSRWARHSPPEKDGGGAVVERGGVLKAGFGSQFCHQAGSCFY